MKAIIFLIVGVLLIGLVNATAAHASMQDDVNQAVMIIQRSRRCLTEQFLIEFRATAKISDLDRSESRVHRQRQRRERQLSSREPPRVGAVPRQSAREG